MTTTTATSTSRTARAARLLTTASGVRLVARYLAHDALGGSTGARHRVDELGSPRRSLDIPGLSD
ncbi:MAG: hypothetical protein U0R80_12400 [Nocardioidaceae bacterium]